MAADVSIGSVLSLIYLGVVATALAVTIRFTIIRANGAVFMSQVGYLVPLFGVIWSALYFADTINLQTLLALTLILAGIAITRKGGRQGGKQSPSEKLVIHFLISARQV